MRLRRGGTAVGAPVGVDVGAIDVSGPEHEWSKVTAHVDKLVAAGATLVEERHDETSRWVVLQDPEGNEFCAQ